MVSIETTRAKSTIERIVDFARVVSIETIVEAVDGDDMVKSLRTLGVDYMQGLAIGKAEPLDELLKGLGADESRRQERLRLELG